jgi:hypothetical protein
MPTTDRAPRPRGRSEQGRARTVLVLLLLLAIGVGAGLLWRFGVGPLADPEECRAEVGDVTVELATDQAENAALIAAVGVRRGLPARAVSIALATAFQESKLRNIDYGDRDSLGLFQQRPSQGWGSPDQLLDPYFATNAFYDALVEVDGYQELRITEAAQRVQRSGFPEAYEEHAEGARALASALTGWSPGRFTCVVDEPEVSAQQPTGTGLVPRAQKVRADLERAFGDLSLGGFSPEGVTNGHMEGSTHYDGRAVDVFVRPITNENKRQGWAIAQYLVAHADRLRLQHVIFDDRIWSSGRRSESGWRDYRAPGAVDAPPETRAVLEHRDHVHVDVPAGD